MIINQEKSISTIQINLETSNIRKSTKFCLNIIQNAFIEFCNGTSLHGFPQITDFNHDTGTLKISKLFQKISICFWSIMVLIGLTFGIFLINIVLIRYNVTPIITTIETSNYPVAYLAFPGVAICNVNAVWKPNTENIIKRLLNENINEIEIEYFLGNLSSLINYDFVNENLFYIFDILQDKYNYTADIIMKEISQPCNELLYGCRWLTKIVDCGILFRMAKSELGYCCIFNYKADRNTKDIITNERELHQKKTPQIQIAGAGEDIGLRVYIKIDEINYISSRKSFSGVEVILFGPYDYPQRNFVASVVQPGYETAIGIKPSAVDTDIDIESFSEQKRACLFSNENNLTISRRYTYHSCLVECRANMILKRCDCLPYFYPSVDYHQNNFQYRWCTFKDLKCLNENKHEFHSILTQTNNTFGKIFDDEQEGLDCECVPSCRSNSYNTETFYMKRMNSSKGVILNSDGLINNTNEPLGFVKVYYKQLSCIKYIRKIYMTWDNLLGTFFLIYILKHSPFCAPFDNATIGGIYGLCLGGSVLSLVQICYYLTIKVLEVYLSKNREIEENTMKVWVVYYLTDYQKPPIGPVYTHQTQIKSKF